MKQAIGFYTILFTTLLLLPIVWGAVPDNEGAADSTESAVSDEKQARKDASGEEGEPQVFLVEDKHYRHRNRHPHKVSHRHKHHYHKHHHHKHVHHHHYHHYPARRAEEEQERRVVEEVPEQEEDIPIDN